MKETIVVFIVQKATHPEMDRPLVNYNLASYMQPMILLGTIFGVLLNILLPDILIILFLMIILGLSAYKTFKKARRLAKEAEEKEKIGDEEGDGNSGDSGDNSGGEMKVEVGEEEEMGDEESGMEMVVIKQHHQQEGEEVVLGDEIIQPTNEEITNQPTSEDEISPQEDGDNNGDDGKKEFGKIVIDTIEDENGPLTQSFLSSLQLTMSSNNNTINEEEEREKIQEKDKIQYPPLQFGILLLMTLFLIIYASVRV